MMTLSWEIQRKRKLTRSRSLHAAWVIAQNEDITIYYLIKRHDNRLKPGSRQAGGITLFGSK